MQKREPFSHQKLALEYAKEQAHPALFMEMRLGKNLVTIRDLVASGSKRVLVLAPKTVLHAWARELRLEGQRRVANLNPSCAAERRWLAEHAVNWGLCSYAFFQKHPELADEGWDAVVLDESTCIKSPTASLTKLLLRAFRNSRRYILSGRPNPERSLDLVCQWIFLRGECLGSTTYWDFRSKHCKPPYPGSYDWRISPRAQQRLRALISESAFYLTRESAGVEPVSSYEVRTVEATAEQRKAMKELLSELAWGATATKWTVVASNYVQQIAGGFFKGEVFSRAKISALLEVLAELPAGDRVVVFCRFDREISECVACILREGYTCLSLTGKTSDDERKRISESFAYGVKRGAQVLVAQTKCVKYGMDFAAADTIIYYSNSFSLEERLQSEQRIVHLMKKRPLLYVDLCTEQSIDLDVLEALRNKQEVSEDFLAGALRRLKCE